MGAVWKKRFCCFINRNEAIVEDGALSLDIRVSHMLAMKMDDRKMQNVRGRNQRFSLGQLLT